MKRERSKGNEQAKAAPGVEASVPGGGELGQRVESVLNTSGQRGPAIASLEGASGLFILTGEQLLFHDGHGIRRVTLRDLARIHSDAEGTLRVETPAGVAMSASLVGFDGDEVQHFFGQVRDVTAQVKSLTTPPPVFSGQREVAQPAQVRPTASPEAPRPDAPLPPDPQGPQPQKVTVTAVRRSEEKPAPTEPAPTITVNRRGKRENLNAPAMTAPPVVTPGLTPEPELPPAGSVEIRAVRHGQQRPPVTPLLPSRNPQPEPQEELTYDPTPHNLSYPSEAPASAPGTVVITAAPAPAATLTPAPAPQAAPAPKPKPQPAPLKFSGTDLREAARRAAGTPGRFKVLAATLLAGALLSALLMFLNAQRLLSLWVLVAGGVGAVALLALADLAQLQVIRAALYSDDRFPTPTAEPTHSDDPEEAAAGEADAEEASAEETERG